MRKATVARPRKTASFRRIDRAVDHTSPRLHPPARLALTDRQAEVYAYIREHLERKGYPPSVREIGEHFEIKSPNGVMCHLKALERKGYIDRDAGISRAIRVEDAPFPQGVVDEAQRKIRCLGRVSAGGLVEAVGAPGEWELDDLFSAADSFVVVDGNELEQRLHLKDGDQLLFGHGCCVGMVRLVR